MSTLVLTELDLNGQGRITGVQTPVDADEVVPKSYVDSAIEGTAWKDSVRAASTANVTVSSAPSTLDSITLTSGDRVLLKDQTAPAENGIYVFAAAASPLVRAADANTAAELEQAVVGVEEGTSNADTTWRQTSVNFTINSGAVAWEAFGTSVPDASTTTKGKIEIATQAEVNTGTDTVRAVVPDTLKNATFLVRKVSATIGDNSATQFDVDISAINSAEVTWSLRDASTNQSIIADVKHHSATVLRINFLVAPATNSVKVVVIG